MITLNLTDHELADLDRRRGDMSREDWIRARLDLRTTPKDPRPISEQLAEFHAMLANDLDWVGCGKGLPATACRAILRNNVNRATPILTVQDLAGLTEREAYGIRGVGRRRLKVLGELLGERGLSWRAEG